jgi:pre-mRNA-splicing factor CDC5/CEF1
MSEARNLRSMTMAQTPLLGDENTPLHQNEDGGTGYESATPRHQVTFTPNPLATPRQGLPSDVSATPGGPGATPLRTPMRDNLSINVDGGYTPVGETPRELRKRNASMRSALRAGFENLPKPENNFELMMPEDEEEDAAETPLSQEDAAERDAKVKRKQQEEARKALARRTQPIQLNLPRPPVVNVEQLAGQLNRLDTSDEPQEVQALINAELAELLQHDSIVYPIPGAIHPGSTKSTYMMPADEDVDTAKSYIHLELSTLVGFPGADPVQLREGLKQLAAANEEIDATTSWAAERQRLILYGSTGRWIEPDSIPLEDRIAGYNQVLSDCRNQMTQDSTKAAKVENKLKKVLGGYQVRSDALGKRITDAFTQLIEAKLEYESFSRLSMNESVMGPQRVASLREEVEKLSRRERILQERHAELLNERRDVEERVNALEEKVMLEAEALNEEQLAMDDIQT